MDAATLTREMLTGSRLTKSELCTRAGISRALFDNYLRGTTKPSLGQLTRLAEAADLMLDVTLIPSPLPLPESFAAVLEFGEIFPSHERDPLPSLGQIWREAARRHHG